MYSPTNITLIHLTLIMHGNDSMYFRKTSSENASAWSLPCSMSTHNETFSTGKLGSVLKLVSLPAWISEGILPYCQTETECCRTQRVKHSTQN